MKRMGQMTEIKDHPLVSVIMPCYNDGKYLPEAVTSLRNQTYPNIELIIIDDGSDDPQTRNELERVDFSNVKVLHTDHVRPAGARNVGIKAATGEYILPLDSDDMIEPEYIERAVAEIRKNPNIGIVYCHADLFGEESGPWALPDYSLKLELLDNCIFVTALFRKADWELVGGFSQDFVHGMEDYDFWLSLLGLGRDVVQLSEVFFHYRIKSSSRTTSFNENLKAIQETYVRLYERHRDLYVKHMDMYCLEMRRALIQATTTLRFYESNASNVPVDDPVVAYWKSVRLYKPKMAAFVNKMLSAKNRIKKMIGRE